MTEQHISATFEVHAGTYTEFTLDTTDMSDQDIVAHVEREGTYVSVCSQCSHQIIDPEVGDLTSVIVDGRELDLTGKPETGA